MNISMFLAQALSLYFLLVGFAFAIQPQRVQMLIRKMLDDEAVLFLTGFIALILGIMIVISHNIWVMHWPVVITLVGWMALIKGFSIISFPKITIKMSEKWLKYPSLYYVSWIVLLGLGLYFGYHGFF